MKDWIAQLGKLLQPVNVLAERARITKHEVEE